MNPVTDIPLDLIDADPDQPRKYFDEAKLNELAVTIKEHGVQSPAVVYPNPNKPGRFILERGERRLRASIIADVPTLPCLVEEPKEPGLRLELQLIENSQREGIGPLEEGEAYLKLKKQYGHTIETLMERTGKGRSHVYARMKLTELVPSAKKALQEGKLQPAIAELAGSVADLKLQEQFVKECIGERIDIYDLEKVGILFETVTDEHELAGGSRGSATSETPTPLSFRAAKALLRRRYSTRLALAKFDPSDAALTPAGACGPCPFRSGNQPELPGMTNGKAAEDLCTNTKCFEEKTKAAWKKTAEQASKDGRDVLSYQDAQKERVFDSLGIEVRESSPYVDPDKPLPYDLQESPGKPQTWSKLLGKKAADIPRAIVQDASGAPRELLDYNAAVTALRDMGKIDKPTAKPAAPAKPKPTKAEVVRSDDQRALRTAFLKRLEREVIDTAQKGIPEKKEMAWWRWVVECVASSMMGSDSVLVDLVDKKKPWPAQLAEKSTNTNKARAIITGVLFSAIAEMARDEEDEEILGIATLLGIDTRKIAADVSAAAKAEADKDAAKAKKKGKAK